MTTSVPPRHGRVDPHNIQHGYNLADIDRMARIAARRAYSRGESGTDRFELAWSAIAEAICAANSRPNPDDLITAGWQLIMNGRRQMLRAYGAHDGVGMTGARFQAYWSQRTFSSFEDRVVDSAALWQIWHQLPTRSRQALLMLATCDDYKIAADAMGCLKSTFQVLIFRGRQKFLEAWHEGEAPSRQWRVDRRVHDRSGRDKKSGRPRITVSQLEQIRDRRHGGETLASIARDYNVSDSTLSKLIKGKSRPAPDASAPSVLPGEKL